MWEINNTNQVFSFLLSVVLGGMFCLFFDLFRALRKALPHSAIAVFAEDVFFFTACAPITFCFLLATTNGEIRFYVLVGISIGFLITNFTVSPLFTTILVFLFNLIISLLKILNSFFSMISDKIGHFFGKAGNIFLIFFKKALKLVKKLLKKQ